MTDQATDWLFAGGGLLALGAGLKWLWDAIFSRLDKREVEIERKEEEYVIVLKERVSVLEALVTSQGEDIRRLTMALGVLTAKEQRQEPDSIELHQVMNIIATGDPLKDSAHV